MSISLASRPISSQYLAGDDRGVAEQVAPVGMTGNESQCPPLARTTNDDRDARLDRPRIAQCFADRDGRALEPWRPLAPQQWQCLQRIIEMRVPSIERGKVDPGRDVFLREPTDTEPTHRPTGRKHVERGDLLGEYRRMMPEGRRHEHTEPNPLGRGRQPRQRGVRLGQVRPCGTDLRDLAQVIHHPQLVDPGRFGGNSDRPEMFAQPLAPADPIEARQMKPHLDHFAPRRHDLRCHGGMGATASRSHRRGNHDHRLRRMQRIPRLGSHGLASCRPAAELVGDDIGGHRNGSGTVAPPALGRRGVEHHCNAWHPRRTSQLPPPRSQVRVEPERVDDGRESTMQPAGDDLVEHGEGIGRGPQIVLALADHGTQRIAGDDLGRREVLRCPRRFAGRDRTDQDDQGRRWDLHGLADRATLFRSVSPEFRRGRARARPRDATGRCSTGSRHRARCG